MQFTDVFIRRPVFATVLSLIILLIGLRAFSAIPVREFPNIQPSVIHVQTSYSGANAKLMEGFITTPLESALGGVEGLDYIRSSSTQGSSEITLRFKLDADINKALTDVSNAISSVRWKLPSQVKDPIIAQEDPSAEPTVYIKFGSKTVNSLAISDYLLRVVQPQLAILPGVSRAEIYGEQRYSMRLLLDPSRMAAHGITASDISQALANNNVQAAPGKLSSPWQEIDINAQTELNTEKQFNDIVIKNKNDYLLRLSNVGRAKLGSANNTVSLNMNGERNALVIGIIPQPTANPLSVSEEINKVMPNIISDLPAGVDAKIIWDSSKFIKQSLTEVRRTIFEAVACVVAVIFLFLGSLRAVFIPIVTIPLSLIGICSVMLAFGYSINTLTMLAWVLAIGLVVDDSIVVLENIHRHIEEGKKPTQAAIIGAREIGFAVIAMTLTLAAVYAPIGFMSDLTGKLFREFAFTLAGAVIISGFVALTLSPMMSSKFLNHEISKKGFVAKIEEIFHVLMAKYKKILTNLLNKRGKILIIAALIYGGCGLLFSSLPHELAPSEDQGVVLTIVSGPTSANLTYTEKYTQQLEAIYKKTPEMEGYGIINGVPSGKNTAFSFLVLKPWEERHRHVNEIIQSLFPQLWGIPGIKAFPINPPALPSGDFQFNFILKTTGSYEQLNEATEKLLTTIKAQNPRLFNLDSDLKLNKPQVNISIDRNKANALGITMSDIATTLNTLLGEPSDNQFELNGRSYYAVPQLDALYMNYAEQLNNINLHTASNDLMPLSNIVTITEGATPQSLNHFQQLRSATISANLAPGYTLGEALDYLKKTARQTLPDNIHFDSAGESRQYEQTSSNVLSTFTFALIFIFLVLAAQFESFRDPLIVIVSVPLSLTGALIAIYLTGGTLNIYTQIGLVTLIGLITKHGILIVEFANQLQHKGLALKEAVIESASLRLRPILMTTGAMLFGALPLAMASGAGSASRSQLGWVILGGMSFGTLFTLFVVPTVYTFLATRKLTEVEENAKY